jgi:hypothetical protein
LNVSGNVDAGNWLPLDAILLESRRFSIVKSSSKDAACLKRKKDEARGKKSANFVRKKTNTKAKSQCKAVKVSVRTEPFSSFSLLVVKQNKEKSR